MIAYVQGDALGSDAPLAVAHGCNLIGVMGRGFALAVHQRWPDCYEDYRALCSRRHAALGDVHTWICPVTPGRVVFNCFTQPRPGPCATLDAIEQCLTMVVSRAREMSINAIAMPWIGCGLGGLSRDDVRAVFERLSTTGVTLMVFDRQSRR